MSDWRDAVHRLAEVGWDAHADWMLTGTAAEAVHGINVEPNELHVIVRRLSDLIEMAIRLTAPGASKLPLAGDEYHTSGRWEIAGVPVGIDHHASRSTDLLLGERGHRLWESRQTVVMNDIGVPVVPMEVLAAANLVTTDDPRVARLLARGWDRPLLAEALRGQGYTARTLALKYPEVSALMN